MKCISVAIAILFVISPCTTFAQLIPPDVQMKGARNPEVPTSASEAAYHVRIQRTKTYEDLSYRRETYPKDSMQVAISDTARSWVAYLQSQPVRGIQHDPFGIVMVAAHQDTAAKLQIAARLAEPGLSLTDKAYTFYTAVTVFADADAPTRLLNAESYARQLDELGSKVAFWRFNAHRALQEAYYILGQRPDVIRHGEQAVRLIKDLEFIDRRFTAYGPDGRVLYAELIDALSGSQDGQAKLEDISSLLTAGAIPNRDLVARDSIFYQLGMEYEGAVRNVQSVSGRIGSKGQDVYGNYWVNLAEPGVGKAEERTIGVSKGKVTLLEVGGYDCNPCVASLQAMQRLQHQFPQIQTVFATSTLGSVGNRLVEASEEADTVASRFIRRNKVTDVPISIWMAKRIKTDDDGLLPENSGPNSAFYRMAAKPTFYIMDGKGIIRRVMLGALGRDQEAQFARTITYLLHEDSAAPPTSVRAGGTRAN